MRIGYAKSTAIALIGICIILFIVSDLKQYFTPDYLKSGLRLFREYYAEHTEMTIGAYMLIYIAITILCMPVATVIRLAGGAVFGFWIGTIVISLSSSIGATLAFLVSRFLFRDYIQKKFGNRLKTVNQGIEKEGAFYLFTLRVFPIIPFFMVNLLMGISPIRTRIFYLVSQIGAIPGAMIYANAGSRLSKIGTFGDIFSPAILISFALIGIFPFFVNKVVQITRCRYSEKIASQ